MIERLLLAAIVTISLCWFLQLRESSFEPNFLGKKLPQASNIPKLFFTGF